jgi:peptidoglycan endopeptidase LytF
MTSKIPSCPGGTLYNIRPGDTFFNIASRFGITVQELMRANPTVDPNNLRICDLICVPAQPRPGVCPTGSVAYLVASGDTLFSIAAKHNTTVDAIISANPCVDPMNLRVSQLLCIPGPAPTQCPPGSTQYAIRPGDTLFSLAIQFNTTVQAILAINPGLDPNNLRVGQVICIPGSTPGRCPAGSFEYTIRSGDTIYNLAIEFNTTVEAILALNPGINPNNLQIGQVICIPGTGPGPGPGRCPAGTFEYTVRPGDTFFSLANRFNTTVAAIQAANQNVDPNNLQIGQVICIPGTGPGPGPGRCPAGTFEYTVRSGDTFFSLANRFNTTVAAIQAANPNVDPNNLQIGQTICIPRS